MAYKNLSGTFRSPNSSPYFNYRISYTETARGNGTASYRVNLDVFMTTQYDSFGYYLDAQLVIGNASKTIRLKENTPTWYGTTVHSYTYNLTATNAGVGSGYLAAAFIVTSNSGYSGLISLSGGYGVSLSSYNSAPKNPTWFNAGGTTVHENNIKFSWGGASDADGNTITYRVYARIWNPSGTLTHDGVALYNSTGTSFTYDISGFARGTKFQFWMNCYDGYVRSVGDLNPTDSSAYHYRNLAPSTPSYISPSSGIYQGSIPISWGASSDGNGHSVTYDLQVSINGSSWTTVAIGISGTSRTYSIPDINIGGSTYKFRIRAKDSLGAYSDWRTAGSSCYKNKIPTVPGTVYPYGGYYENSINVSWGSSSDGDGHAITYIVETSINGGNWMQIASGISTPYYTYNISTHTRGARYKFRVRAKDSINGYSGWRETTGFAYRNRKPDPPTLTYPVPNKTIYSKRPRIMFTVNADADGHKQKAYVYWNNTWYNSYNHSSYFSKSGNDLTQYTKIVFLPPTDCSTGSITVKIKTNDGLVDSSEQSYTLTVANDTLPLIQDGETKISKDLFTSIRSTINTVRTAYGLSNFAFTNPTLTSGVDVPKSQWLIDIKTSLDDIINKINTWDSTNINKDIIITWMNASIGTVFEYEHFEQFYNMIRSL